LQAGRTQDERTLEQRLAQAEARLLELESVEAIRRLLARYCRALDARDLMNLSTLFARDAHLVVTPWNVDVRSRDAITEFYRQFFATPAQDDRHYAVNQIIEKYGDGYRSFCYFHATEVQGSQSIVGWGTYEDRLIQEDGQWKFAERRITIHVLTPIEKGWAGPDKIAF